MRLTGIALVLLCAVAFARQASAAAAPDNKPHTPKPRPHPAATDHPERPGRPGGGNPEDAVNWDEVRDFYTAHSPHRWQAFDNLPADRQQKLRGSFARRFMMVQWLKHQNEDLCALKTDEIRLEDEVFKIHLDMDKADSAGGPKSPASQKLRTDLRGKIHDLVGIRLREREERIKHLRTSLKGEEARLQEDRDNLDKIEEREYQAELNGRPGEARPPN